MASSNVIASSENPKFSLSGHMPADAASLVSSKSLSQAIAEKAAAVYAHYHENAPADNLSAKKAKVKRCETCKPLRKFCHHNAPIEVGSKNDVDAAAKKIFEFFIGQYRSHTVDIVGVAQAYLGRREDKDEATEFVVDLVLGVVGVIQAYQTVRQPNVTIEPTTRSRNSLPKGTTSVMYTGSGYAEEVNVGVFENLVASLDDGWPDGTEGDAGWGADGGDEEESEEIGDGEEGGESSD